MGALLDSYMYGFPSEESLCFQNGIYVINAQTDLEKIATITSNEMVDFTIEAGKPKRIANRRIALDRVSKAIKLEVDDDSDGELKTYMVAFGMGDSPIVDTCIALAESSSSGIGILLRYDFSQRKTFISCRVTEESGLNAGKIMRLKFGGGGSRSMGGCSIPGLHFPEDLVGQKTART